MSFSILIKSKRGVFKWQKKFVQIVTVPELISEMAVNVIVVTELVKFSKKMIKGGLLKWLQLKKFRPVLLQWCGPCQVDTKKIWLYPKLCVHHFQRILRNQCNFLRILFLWLEIQPKNDAFLHIGEIRHAETKASE